MALKEADQGQFISQEAMTRWTDSLGTPDEEKSPKADVDTSKHV